MKVRELKEWLENEPDDHDVLVNDDGNYRYARPRTNPSQGYIVFELLDEYSPKKKFKVVTKFIVEHEYEVEAENQGEAETIAEGMITEAAGNRSLDIDDGYPEAYTAEELED